MTLEVGPLSSEGELWIHIGTPKTGSTSLQAFLLANEKALSNKGTHYIKHGRKNISHNMLAPRLRSETAAQEWSSIAAEVDRRPNAFFTMSSEALFNKETAAAVVRYMPEGLRKRTRVIVYARRQDLYLEALFKQGLKRGRIKTSPQDFFEHHGVRRCDYAAILDCFAEAIGPARITLRRFERPALVEGDIIADFLSLFGLKKNDADFTQPHHEANQTPSRAIAEQLGALARHSRLNVKELVRELARDPQGAPRRSGDVFTKQQRKEIMARFEAGNTEIARRFLDEGEQPLFDLRDLAPDAPERYPDCQEEIALYAAAQERIAAAIGRIERRDPRRIFRR